MSKELLQFPAIIKKIETMSNKSLKIRVDSQENLTSEQIAKIVSNHDCYGWFCFLADKKLDPEQVLKTPDYKPEFKEDKHPSQRLRNVLWKLWEKNGKQGEFDIYYKSQIEKIIDTVKDKLN